jgi:hypothetical protein
MQSKIAIIVLPIAVAASGACAAAPRVTPIADQHPSPVRQVQASVVVVPSAPPPPRVETVPPPPSATVAWRAGYWSWSGTTYVWVPGAYVARPEAQLAWVPGQWIQQSNGWVWVEGHWH